MTPHRCQCTGECGETHNWTAEVPARRCNAPQGIDIVRKLDHPSFWQLAPSATADLEYRDLYKREKVTVALTPVELPGLEPVLVCQRCKILITRGASAAAAAEA